MSTYTRMNVSDILKSVVIREHREPLPDPSKAMRMLVRYIEALQQQQPEREHLGLVCLTPEGRDQLCRDMLDCCEDIGQWFIREANDE